MSDDDDGTFPFQTRLTLTRDQEELLRATSKRLGIPMRSLIRSYIIRGLEADQQPSKGPTDGQ